MPDQREQTRRDAAELERLIFDCEFDEHFEPVALELKRVRAELEQAERERDKAKRVLALADEDAEITEAHLKARLAKVPALVEALREADELVSKAHDIIWAAFPEWEGEHGRREPLNAAMWRLHEHLRPALAAFEEPGV